MFSDGVGPEGVVAQTWSSCLTASWRAVVWSSSSVISRSTGAQLGLPDEVIVSGRLSAVVEEIRTNRAAVRQARGWVMDTYLLRPALW